MIYFCELCNKTSFEVNCPWCSGVAPAAPSPWNTNNSVTQPSNIQKLTLTPLEPAFYPEFHYKSKGMLKDFFGKKKEQSHLDQLLETVLDKYAHFKDPYFTNFIYTFRPSIDRASEDGNEEESHTYSDLTLFREVLIRKGFNELEQFPDLLYKLLLTTTFNALYSGFAKEITRHIKENFTESVRSWINESGTRFREDLSLFLFYIWDNKISFPSIAFNDSAQNTPGIPLVSFENIQNYLNICEQIYFDILVDRLTTRLENFNPQRFITMYHVDAMNGFQFEDFLVEVFQTMGYDVKETQRTQDQGADLFVSRFGKSIVIQAKNYSGSVGNSAIQQVISAKTFYGCDDAMVITNSYFTKSAKELADSALVRLIDRDELQKHLDDYNQKIIENFQATM